MIDRFMKAYLFIALFSFVSIIGFADDIEEYSVEDLVQGINLNLKELDTLKIEYSTEVISTNNTKIKNSHII